MTKKEKNGDRIIMIMNIKTNAKTQMIDITSQVQKAVKSAGISDGLVYVCSMHTTGAITINENADPDVTTDLKTILDKLVPWNDGYKHLEGNSAAHMKTSFMGTSELIAIENGSLVLGTWQGIYFCEFDGPRSRKIFIKFIQ